jgi:GT2 family glycosyltransferase
MIEATFVFVPIRPDYIEDALKSLYAKTPIEFRVVVVDQTVAGIYDQVKDYADMYIKVKRNLGFSKANNEGIIHGLHWGSKYIVACNDDVLFIDERWWPGIIEQFERYPEMMAVNPASVIEPGWGYGLNESGWVPGNSCPDWGVAVGADIWPKKSDGKPLTFEEAMTKEGYDFMLEHRKGHIEGFAGWCVVGKREMWEKVGLYDERFWPGGGEDYDLAHRIYVAKGRCSATLSSFVWHYWGKSKDLFGGRESGTVPLLPGHRSHFQDTNALFVHSPDGANSPIYPPRDNEQDQNKRKRKNTGVFVDDIR